MAIPFRKVLRDHQIGAVSAITDAVRGIVNLPTGTGKTLIQSRTIVDEILNNDPKVYVILSPRILLSNQLMNDVRSDLAQNDTEAQYLVVHSGRYDDKEDIKLEHEFGITFRETLSGTTKKTIQEAYRRSVAENVPLVISGTYHSAERIKLAGVPVEIAFCDEAHYLVQEQFSWIVTQPFPATHTYFFTATLRETASDQGMGMNNPERFGEILYQRKPAELILAGEMVRPRMHLVDLSLDPEDDEADGLAVAEAFEEHNALTYMGAKLLVVAKDGSDHLNAIATHPEIQRLREVRPALRVFDISSHYGPRINGESHNRQSFLQQLRGLTDTDEAIIIHHDILTEGIDVPGITGVMPLLSLRKAKFLQTLGRATRLHGSDRVRLYAEQLGVGELRRFTKPYAWLIIPIYGIFGDDLQADLREMVREMREHGFNPSEDIVIRPQRGRRQPVPIETVTEPSRAVRRVADFAAEVLHDLEKEDDAIIQKQEECRVNELSPREFWHQLGV